jgi:hypothetical protein
MLEKIILFYSLCIIYGSIGEIIFKGLRNSFITHLSAMELNWYWNSSQKHRDINTIYASFFVVP